MPGIVAVAHPYPSILVASVTATLALVSGGSPARALLLGLAMLGFQLSIGAANDLADAPDDERAGRPKPIPTGRVSRAAAQRLAAIGGFGGVVLSALAGVPATLVGVAGYAIGLAYDAGLKRRGLGAACFAAAVPMVPAYAALGGTGTLPPSFELLLPMAALAGIALAASNSLADLDRDLASGTTTLATGLGPGRSLAVACACLGAVIALGVATSLRSAATLPTLGLLAAGAAVVVVGLAVSARPLSARIELGWELQALGVGLFGIGWMAITLAT